MKRTALYRHFDGAGRLLYVGISLHSIQRTMQHRAGSRWFEKIARISIEWLPSRDEALIAEAKAIGVERPEFNIQKAAPRALKLVAQQPKLSGLGVMHTKTGRIDGWYFDGSADHMLGWFRAVFPGDEFQLIRAGHAGIVSINKGRELRPHDCESWASIRPDWSAGDDYERRAA